MQLLSRQYMSMPRPCRIQGADAPFAEQHAGIHCTALYSAENYAGKRNLKTPRFLIPVHVNKFKYSGPSLNGHSREDTPLKRTQILASKYHECIYDAPSLIPKDSSLIRTELFGRRGVPIGAGLLYKPFCSF